jgi:predicted DNA-binding transcriptional regulator AlpA
MALDNRWWEQVDWSQLVMQKGIAEMYGVRQNTVSNWTDRHADFPKPVMSVGRVKLYVRSEVEAWVRPYAEPVEEPITKPVVLR